MLEISPTASPIFETASARSCTRWPVWSASPTAACARLAEPSDLPGNLPDAGAELLGCGRDGADVGGRLLGGGRDAGRLRRRLGRARRQGLGRGLSSVAEDETMPTIAPTACSKPSASATHRAPALGFGGLVRHALRLGLVARPLPDQRLDALDRLADQADLVAAPSLGDLGIERALAHALQDADQAVERTRDGERHQPADATPSTSRTRRVAAASSCRQRVVEASASALSTESAMYQSSDGGRFGTRAKAVKVAGRPPGSRQVAADLRERPRDQVRQRFADQLRARMGQHRSTAPTPDRRSFCRPRRPRRSSGSGRRCRSRLRSRRGPPGSCRRLAPPQ